MRVERIEIRRRSLRQFLNLTLAYNRARLLFHGLTGGIEGNLGGLFGHHATHAQRIRLDRQIEFGVQWMKADHSRCSVTQAPDPNFAKHGQESTFMQAYNFAQYPVSAAHRFSRRPRPTAVNLRLKQQPLQLSASLAKRQLA